MDNFAIEQDWIMLCNLRTRRSKKQHIQTASNKQITALHKEHKFLSQVAENPFKNRPLHEVVDEYIEEKQT